MKISLMVHDNLQRTLEISIPVDLLVSTWQYTGTQPSLYLLRDLDNSLVRVTQLLRLHILGVKEDRTFPLISVFYMHVKNDSYLVPGTQTELYKTSACIHVLDKIIMNINTITIAAIAAKNPIVRTHSVCVQKHTHLLQLQSYPY